MNTIIPASHRSMGQAVRVVDVYKQFGSLAALKNVNFEVPKGSFFGLLGPNGAGKSTLINIMAGLTHATQGTVTIMGHDVRENWREARKTIGVVPQELAYDPFFSARELLRLQSGYFGYGAENYAWIDELLERLNLTQKRDDNMNKLSGGMKRRVLIAQALVHKPDVVILDEPTAGVDVELRKILWDFIRQLHQSGHTILLTTHYLEEAEALCDQIAILNQGELIALDTTKALVGRFPFRYLYLTLKEPKKKLPDALQSRVISFDQTTLCLKLHREKDRIGDILETCYAAGIAFNDLRTDDPGLEDVFIELTGEK